LGEDVVLGLPACLPVGAGSVCGVGIGPGSLVVSGEGGGAVFEDGLRPEGEAVDGEGVFLADLGDEDIFDAVPSEQGGFLFGAEVATLLRPGRSSARVVPLTLSKASSCFDWGDTIPGP
jgi:hypothetical protein